MKHQQKFIQMRNWFMDKERKFLTLCEINFSLNYEIYDFDVYNITQLCHCRLRTPVTYSQSFWKLIILCSYHTEQGKRTYTSEWMNRLYKFLISMLVHAVGGSGRLQSSWIFVMKTQLRMSTLTLHESYSVCYLNDEWHSGNLLECHAIQNYDIFQAISFHCVCLCGGGWLFKWEILLI